MAEAAVSRGALAHLGEPAIAAGEALAIRVVPDRAFIGVRARPDEAGLLDAFCEALGAPLPRMPNTTQAWAHGTLVWLGPDEWLIEVDGAQCGATLGALERAAGDRFAALTDLTHGRTCVELRGARAADCLRKGVTIDLHPRAFAAGACARTGLAKAGVLILALDAGGFRLVADRSYADYLWRWLADASLEFAAGIEHAQPSD